MTHNPAKSPKINPMEADCFERMEAELDNAIFDGVACILGNPDCPKCKKPDVTNRDFPVALPTNPDLLAVLRRASSQSMTSEQMNRQRLSFVYGQLGADNQLTKDQVADRLAGMGYGQLSHAMDDNRVIITEITPDRIVVDGKVLWQRDGDQPEPEIHVTSFDDGHEITMPKRMTSDEAARYAATNDLF